MPVSLKTASAGLTSWAFLLALLIVNLINSPYMLNAQVMFGMLAVAMPLVLGAMAVTPSILSGGGGLDLSIGPLMGFINILLVTSVGAALPGFAAVVVLMLIGAVIGGLNGVLVAIVRVQPIVATLGTYLILSGINLWLLPIPIGPAPDWLLALSRSVAGIPGSVVLLLIPAIIWLILLYTPFVRTLLAVGGDDRVAFSVGINVTAVRILAYALGGLIAAVAGIALTALIQSADASVGPPFTLQVVTAAALGGISLAGGRGGMRNGIKGALSLFLIQTLLTDLGVSTYWQQVCFGGTLLLALVLNSNLTAQVLSGWRRR